MAGHKWEDSCSWVTVSDSILSLRPLGGGVGGGVGEQETVTVCQVVQGTTAH